MTSVKYIGMDVHKESISICVRNSVGKVVQEWQCMVLSETLGLWLSLIVREGVGFL